MEVAGVEAIIESGEDESEEKEKMTTKNEVMMGMKEEVVEGDEVLMEGSMEMSEDMDLNQEQSLLQLLGIENFGKEEEEKEEKEEEEEGEEEEEEENKSYLISLEEFFAPFNMELNGTDHHQTTKTPKYNKNNNFNISKLESTPKPIPSNHKKEYDDNNNLTTTTNNNSNNEFDKSFFTDNQKVSQDQRKDLKQLQQQPLKTTTQQQTTLQSTTLKQQQQTTPHNILTQQHNHNNTLQQTEKCVGCMKPITERYLLKVMEQSWHEDCLKCSCCNCRLGEVGSTLFTRANLMLCKRDYLRLFGASGYCSSCSKAIPAFEMVMKARGHVYHLDCFSCYYCNHRFCVGDRYYLHDNKILCETDYEEKVSNNRLNPTSNNNHNNNSLLITSPSLPFPSVSPTYINNNPTTNNNTIPHIKGKSYLNPFPHHQQQHQQQQQYNQLISSQPFQLQQQQQQQYLQQQQHQHSINNNFLNGLNSRS